MYYLTPFILENEIQSHILCDCSNIYIIFAEICAILYDDQHYHGWNFKVPEMNSENLLGQFDNHVSSIKLRDGCMFQAYNQFNNEIYMFTTNDDMEDLSTFDNQMSSFSCECTTSRFYSSWFIPTL